MARKILALLIITIMLTSIMRSVQNIKAADSVVNLDPDIMTDKILFVSSDPQLISTLQKGTLGIVSFNSGNYMGFDVPGGNLGTDIIVSINNPISVSFTNPVALVLKNGRLEIYLSKSLWIISLSWSALQIPEIPEIYHSWFPQYLPAQIVRIEDTAVFERETNYCYNPPVTRISYFYKLYLTSEIDPYNPPVRYNIEIEVMIPDYLIDMIKKLTINKDFMWVGINGDNQIYIWLPH